LLGLLLLGCLPGFVHAQTRIDGLEVYRRDGWLSCEIRSSDMMDPRIESTVESGLPGACLYELRLKWSDDGEIVRLPLQLSLRLDLWEEVYYVEGAGREERFSSLARADSAWAHLENVRLLPLDQLDANRPLELEVMLIVSPLGAEQRAWIDDYVSQASRNQRSELTLNLGGFLKKVFGNDKDAGRASASRSSAPFTVRGLEARP
jgi:hypothetical protein